MNVQLKGVLKFQGRELRGQNKLPVSTLLVIQEVHDGFGDKTGKENEWPAEVLNDKIDQERLQELDGETVKLACNLRTFKFVTQQNETGRSLSLNAYAIKEVGNENS